jgi:hypothetical protein
MEFQILPSLFQRLRSWSIKNSIIHFEYENAFKYLFKNILKKLIILFLEILTWFNFSFLLFTFNSFYSDD